MAAAIGVNKSTIGSELRRNFDLRSGRYAMGDLETDTIIGKNHKGAAVTINDRVTGYLRICRLSGKEAAPLADRTIEALLPYKQQPKAMMADNEKEFAKHGLIARQLDINF